MRTVRLGGVLVALILVLAGCGGDDDGGTTTAGEADAGGTTVAPLDVATTTVADDGGDDGDAGEVSSMDDMPGECRDIFVDYLRALEPAVADIDFESATLAELDTVFTDLEPVLDDFDEQMETLDCPDLDTDDPAVREDVIAFVQDEAPGAVAFVEYSLDLAGEFAGAGDGEDGSGDSASGDCETDMAAAQEFVDAGGTMEDLTLAELSEVGALFMSVQTNCTLDQMEDFFSQPDVEDFLGSGG